MLAAKDDSYNGPRPITQTEDMADFLQPRLLGILAFFDSQLLNSHIPLEDKKLVSFYQFFSFLFSESTL